MPSVGFLGTESINLAQKHFSSKIPKEKIDRRVTAARSSPPKLRAVHKALFAGIDGQHGARYVWECCMDAALPNSFLIKITHQFPGDFNKIRTVVTMIFYTNRAVRMSGFTHQVNSISRGLLMANGIIRTIPYNLDFCTAIVYSTGGRNSAICAGRGKHNACQSHNSQNQTKKAFHHYKIPFYLR